MCLTCPDFTNPEGAHIWSKSTKISGGANFVAANDIHLYNMVF